MRPSRQASPAVGPHVAVTLERVRDQVGRRLSRRELLGLAQQAADRAGVAERAVVAAARVLRLALLEHGDERCGDEDRRVRAGADADEQGEGEVLQRLAAEEVQGR